MTTSFLPWPSVGPSIFNNTKLRKAASTNAVLYELGVSHLAAMQAVLCEKIRTQLETQGPKYCKQLLEREAVDTLLKAVEAGNTEAKSRLSSLLQVMPW